MFVPLHWSRDHGVKCKSMKSQICEVCGKDFRSRYFHTGKGGECLDFADYKALPENAVGHPFGSGWFCEEHCEEAKSLRALKFEEAIEFIRKKHLISVSGLPTGYGNIKDPELWILDIGENKSKVFSIIRRAMGVTPQEAKSLLASGCFKVISAWPAELSGYEKELSESGATTEVRYDT